MLIHNVWEMVLGSKVKVKIARVLCKYPAKRFTIRELARLIQGSHTPVLRSLPELQGMNLIRMEKHGTANLITLNTKSNLTGPLQMLFTNELKVKIRLKNRIAALIPGASMIAWFGSMVRGNETMNSDIDLLIVSNNKKKIKSVIENTRKGITEECGSLISPIIFTEREFKAHKNKPFAKDLINNYEILAGKDLVKAWWIDD